MQCTMYSALMHYCPLCLSAVRAFITVFNGICVSAVQPLSIWRYEKQIAHHKLVENKIMIHQTVDATVPYVVKSDLDMLGSRCWLQLSAVATPWQ